jgi:hypothetical protein
MTTKYLSMTDLATAAKAKDCAVHMHLDDKGRPVFSVGSEDIGAREFSCYFDALEYVSDPLAYTEGDCAEEAGAMIAQSALDDMLTAISQGVSVAVLHKALVDLQRLTHPTPAAAGFAVALMNTLEVGLKNLPKAAK